MAAWAARYVAAARRALPKAAAAEAWAEGQGMSSDRAVADALHGAPEAEGAKATRP
jgi:hypothetical protein